MGGLVSGLVDTVGDTLSSGANLYKKIQAPIFDNAALIGTGAGYALGGAAGARLGGMLGGAVQGSLGGSGTNILGGGTPQTYGNLLQGSLLAGGQLAQNRVSREAAQAAQRQALEGGQTAANMAAFRPVGTTTRFGTSSYSIDPATGGLKADYSLSPLAAGYQGNLADMTGQGLMQGQQIQSLAGQYLGESPEAVRQRVMQQRMDLLAPSRERELARILNTNYQTGTGGLSVGATGIRPGGGEGLRAANPRLEAYYNSIAQADLQNAATAEQEARNQIQFGQQLAGQAYSPFTAGFGAQGAVETAAQQPLTLAQDIARLQAASGAQQGQLYGQGAQRAAAYNLLPELQTSTAATLLGGLASPTSGLSGLFSGLGGGGFAGNPSGLGIGGIDYGNLSTIYSGGNPFEGILGAGETWYGE
jgi:hypothetical protein